jgi:cytochrome c5
VHVRSILTAILPLLLGGVLVNACDSKEQPKADDKKAVATADEKKADDLKADEAKADDVKALDAAVSAGDAEPPEDGIEDTKVEDGIEDTKVEDTKVEDTKADPDTKGEKKGADEGEKKGEDKPDAKKADDKKADDKKPEPAAAKIDAKDLYSKKCASCHGGSGKADTKLGEKYKIENWQEPGWKGKWSLAKVEGIVTNGKADTKMKAFKDKLSPEEIKAVSKYAHGLGK